MEIGELFQRMLVSIYYLLTLSCCNFCFYSKIICMASFLNLNFFFLILFIGLQRCGKSCRLRWTNYLRPDIKRGRFSFEEEETIIQLHSILGNKYVIYLLLMTFFNFSTSVSGVQKCSNFAFLHLSF